MFWDGHVTTFEEQAIKPLLNPLEMNNSNTVDVLDKIKNGDYASLFKKTFGETIFEDTAAALQSILKAIAEFERTEQVSPFTSKYDAYLAGNATRTTQELGNLHLTNQDIDDIVAFLKTLTDGYGQ